MDEGELGSRYGVGVLCDSDCNVDRVAGVEEEDEAKKVEEEE
jgi:hypothetical protein